MAAFEQLPSGRWRAKVRKAGWPAQQQTFDTRKAAQTWATATEAEMNAGTHARSEVAITTTLADALDWYEREVTPRKKGALQERKRIARWKREPFATKALADLTTDDFEQWMTRRRVAGISPTTCRTDLALIGHMFTMCRKRRKLHIRNPISDMELPPKEKGRERRLEETGRDGTSEADFLLLACGAGMPYLLPLVRLALESGARQGELLSLHWEDVDFQRREMTFLETKAGGPRTVDLTPLAIDTLRQWRGDLPRVGTVFPVTGNAVTLQFTKIVRRAGIDNFRFHDLRHHATSEMFDKGLTIPEVASQTGHHDSKTLLSYAHASRDRKRKKLAMVQVGESQQVAG